MSSPNELNLRQAHGGVLIPVKIVPGASRDKVVGALAGRLKIATSAPPEKGKANAAVAKALAEALGVDRRNVTLVTGRTNPRKEFHVAGATIEEVRRRLDKCEERHSDL